MKTPSACASSVIAPGFIPSCRPPCVKPRRERQATIVLSCRSRPTTAANGLLPDLCIRTGGEHRISNFLLWQLAYAELYFSDLFWPDFKHDAMRPALADFASRQRRFGKTSEQVESGARV